MSITLEQYRASIGGFTPPGLKSLKRRKAAAWRELLGEEVVDRVGREGRKLWIPLVDLIRHHICQKNYATAIFCPKNLRKKSVNRDKNEFATK